MGRRYWADATRSFVEFPRAEIERSIPKRFEYIANRYANPIAIQSGDQTLTYATLEQNDFLG